MLRKNKINHIVLTLILASFYSCKNKVVNLDNDDSGSSSSSTTSPLTDCSTDDDIKPTLTGSITQDKVGTSLTSPEFSWPAGSDDCSLDFYQVSIGTTSGASDVLSATNIGSVTDYTVQNVSLSYQTDYFFTVEAVDEKGNVSAKLTTSSWTIFDPKTMTNMVVWLDSNKKSSIEDASGDNPGDASFSGDVAKWSDISGSNAIHNFTASGSQMPSYDTSKNSVRFSGSGQFLATADHSDINTSTSTQRTLTLAFETLSEVNARQVLYEQGGGTRGLNFYIENGMLYCGFWNAKNDGDGKQDFISVSTSINANEKYIVSLQYDYTNYNGSGGVNGSVECFLNDSSIGSVSTTSRLYSHSGDIGLGSMNDGSRFHDGTANNNNYAFTGHIYEFLMYNTAHTDSDVLKLNDYLKQKYSF
ncbi:hypothetical protein N9N67_02690 [Bacteriovoracaceae bacterium]|nr:hypothetical protein [Bacteriovoracaceae bacterium]